MLPQYYEDTCINAILYILKQLGGCCDIHKICKVLYFADREHLQRYTTSITEDEYVRMQYGPVPSKIYDFYKSIKKGTVTSSDFGCRDNDLVYSKKSPDMDCLSKTHVECLDYAILLCKDKDFSTLTTLSHQGAWKKTLPNKIISYGDIVRDVVPDNEDLISFIEEQHYLMTCKFE